MFINIGYEKINVLKFRAYPFCCFKFFEDGYSREFWMWASQCSSPRYEKSFSKQNFLLGFACWMLPLSRRTPRGSKIDTSEKYTIFTTNQKELMLFVQGIFREHVVEVKLVIHSNEPIPNACMLFIHVGDLLEMHPLASMANPLSILTH